MTDLPQVTGREVARALEGAGFRITHVRGSHLYLYSGDGPTLVAVPVQGDRHLPGGTLHAVLRQTGLDIEAFSRLRSG